MIKIIFVHNVSKTMYQQFIIHVKNVLQIVFIVNIIFNLMPHIAHNVISIHNIPY